MRPIYRIHWLEAAQLRTTKKCTTHSFMINEWTNTKEHRKRKRKKKNDIHIDIIQLYATRASFYSMEPRGEWLQVLLWYSFSDTWSSTLCKRINIKHFVYFIIRLLCVCACLRFRIMRKEKNDQTSLQWTSDDNEVSWLNF